MHYPPPPKKLKASTAGSNILDWAPSCLGLDIEEQSSEASLAEEEEFWEDETQEPEQQGSCLSYFRG